MSTVILKRFGLVMYLADYLSIREKNLLRGVNKRTFQILNPPAIILKPSYHSSEQNHDIDPFTDVVYCRNTVKSIEVSCRWRDQCWGNAKARIWIALLEQESTEASTQDNKEECKDKEAVQFRMVECLDCFGINQSKEQIEHKVFTRDQFPFIEQIKQGQFLQGRREVGGGGGHAIYIHDFQMLVDFDGSPAE